MPQPDPRPRSVPSPPPAAGARAGASPADQLSDQEFAQLRELVYRQTGIDLNEGKRVLLASRLFRRMNTLGLRTYGDYYAHVMSDRTGAEMELLINSVTTNKTDFFRESHHFRYLQDVVFPRVRARAAAGAPPRLRIWSAGCSTGEEPYSIAMTIADGLGQGGRWDARIVATDLDTAVLGRAQAGVYPRERTQPVPAALAQRYLKASPGKADEVVVVPEVRNLVSFQRLNFVEEQWPVQGPFDAIFFRNVAIYFDRPTQERILRRMLALLDPDGDLIVGHSESLHWMGDLLVPVANTVYRRKDAAGSAARRPAAPPPAAEKVPPPIVTHGPHRHHGPHDPAHLARHSHGHVPPARTTPARPSLQPRPEPPPAARVAPRLDSAPVLSRPGAAGEPPLEVITVGGVYASSAPRMVRTLLGSCIAACMWDPEAKVGGMNHFLLPDGGAGEAGSSRFGVHAMELLINEIMKHGGDRRRLKAKVFGGGHVLRVKGFDSAVPRRNAEFVRMFLAKEGIPIVGERLGGHSPLEVKFSTTDGRAFVRVLEPTATADVAAAEAKFVAESKKTVAAPPPPDVELF